MSNATSVIDISHVRVKAGKEARFIEIWPEVVRQFNEASGGAVISAKLLRPQEGDIWSDVWQFTSKEAARAVMEGSFDLPAMKEMIEELTEFVDVEWYDVAGEISL